MAADLSHTDKPGKARRGAPAWRVFLTAVFIALTVRTALADHMYVPSGSMEPTMYLGDHILVSKPTYGYSKWSAAIGTIPFVEGRVFGRAPERGDVIVFRKPGDTALNFTKRVIGLPGDHISIKDGRVTLNGKLLPVRGHNGQAVSSGNLLGAGEWMEELPGGRQHPIQKLVPRARLDQLSEVVVPKDTIFVMGDNRDNSLDSRVRAEDGGVGFVPIENVVGRVEAVVLSTVKLERSFQVVR